MNKLNDHFNELLLTFMSLIFAGCAMWMLRHDAPEDGFKWAAGIAGMVVGALLMKMQAKSDGGGPPDVPPGPLAPT